MSDFLDTNGKKVHAFALDMQNLGFQRMAEKLVSMLDDGAWQDFADGLGQYRFLPGEFDYFLTQQGVTRDDVMNGIRDIEMKARLEEAMDERRTGEDDYRRRVVDAREAIPAKPGRPIEPFGLTKSEAKALLEGKAGDASPQRAPLGDAVRRWRNSKGKTTRKPSEVLPRAERLFRSAKGLPVDELAELIDRLKTELRQRKRRSNSHR